MVLEVAGHRGIVRYEPTELVLTARAGTPVAEIEAALAPKGIYANVDSITGLLYTPMGLPPSALPIPFCLAIQTGWMAHCLEYLPDGRMIERTT